MLRILGESILLATRMDRRADDIATTALPPREADEAAYLKRTRIWYGIR
jgi:hypothetical protein